MKNSRGKGYFVRDNHIHVSGTIAGRRYKRSTGKEANPMNLKWISENNREVLLNIIAKEQQKQPSFDLKTFSHEVLELTSNKRDANQQKEYLSKVDRFIIPYFEFYNLSDIKAYDLEIWQNKLLKEYSSTSVKRVRNIFNMILHKAVGYDLILKNPMDYAESIAVEHQKEEPYTLEEMTLILKGSEGWIKVFLYLAFTTGLRVGELIGLQWEDIDFDRNAIYLKRSISKGVIKTNTRTKNHNRTIILANFVIDMLKVHKELSINEWVFTSRLKTHYYDGKSILDKHFKPLLVRLGVKYKKLKVTRHTYVSLMRNAGVSSDLIVDIVGHSKEVSDKHYYTANINPEKVEIINNALYNLVGENAEKEASFGTISAR